MSGSGWGSGADTEPAEPGIAIPLMNGHYIRSLDYGISFEDPLLNQVGVCLVAMWLSACVYPSLAADRSIESETVSANLHSSPGLALLFCRR